MSDSKATKTLEDIYASAIKATAELEGVMKATGVPQRLIGDALDLLELAPVPELLEGETVTAEIDHMSFSTEINCSTTPELEPSNDWSVIDFCIARPKNTAWRTPVSNDASKSGVDPVLRDGLVEAAEAAVRNLYVYMLASGAVSAIRNGHRTPVKAIEDVTKIADMLRIAR